MAPIRNHEDWGDEDESAGYRTAFFSVTIGSVLFVVVGVGIEYLTQKKAVAGNVLEETHLFPKETIPKWAILGRVGNSV